MTVRAVEFYCGIGGFTAAVTGWNVDVVGAIDQSEAALAVYQLNFPERGARQFNIEQMTAGELAAFGADFWWLSPPCQPYSVRGRRGDLSDPRTRSLLRLLDEMAFLPADLLPRHLAMENVAGFHNSQAHARLLDLLAKRDYQCHEYLLCPTELGIPSRRPRYYLVASRTALHRVTTFSPLHQPLAAYLDSPLTAACPPELRVSDDILDRFGTGFRVLDATDPTAYTTCFTAGYGKSMMYAGAYLRYQDGVRRFSPEEIARLLHFPSGFRFPPEMPIRKRWHLIGNSLSVAAVREILRSFPDLSPPADAPMISKTSPKKKPAERGHFKQADNLEQGAHQGITVRS